MSEIKALEDMRNTVKTIAADCDEGWILGWLDAIEAEIAERFMELPVDADGVPIRVGDYLQLGETRGEAVALRCGARHEVLTWEWLDESGDWYYTAFSHHAKPRTIEDVLEDFELNVLNYGREWELDDSRVAIAECAAEIRELLGVKR